MRYTCDEAGFETAFVEFRTTDWTRRDMRLLRTLDESDEWFALLRGKVTAVSLPVVDGQPIVTADGLTPDAIDGLDLILSNWLTAVIVKAISEVSNLGNAVWRRQFPLVAAADSTETSPTKS